MDISVVFPELLPVPENAFLMSFQPNVLGGPVTIRWSADRTGMPTHCQDTYYSQHAPKHGQWEFELTNMTLTGCPAAVDPTRGLQSITTINWDRFNGPVGALDKFPYPFRMDRTDALQYTYTADQMPRLPGTILIVYDFQAISPDQIDVIGDININIKAGATTIHCAGTLEMQGHPIP